jgi:hypothetical protein
MTRQMSDSAYPMKAPPPGGWRDIILIYAGGDTPHPWAPAEIAAMPSRYRWPCWVRSNPAQVNASTDAAQFLSWLRAHQVPTGTCVILDLETAVDTAYVNTFNLALRAAGWKVTKYGSQNYIWDNPKTDGGTFVALPGGNVLTTEGDTVARQYGFEGGYDLSITEDQDKLPLWDIHPPGNHKHLTVDGDTLGSLATSRGESPEDFVAWQRKMGTKIHPLVSGPLPAGTEWRSVAP